MLPATLPNFGEGGHEKQKASQGRFLLGSTQSVSQGRQFFGTKKIDFVRASGHHQPGSAPQPTYFHTQDKHRDTDTHNTHKKKQSRCPSFAVSSHTSPTAHRSLFDRCWAPRSRTSGSTLPGATPTEPYPLIPSETKRYQLEPNGAELKRVVSNSTERNRTKPNGTEWNQMEPNGTDSTRPDPTRPGIS